MEADVKTPRLKKAAPHLLQAATVAFLATLMGLPVQAALTIPAVPPSSGNGAPPNIRFILDDSGSMGYFAMPQNISNESSISDQPRYRAVVRNTIYYDPARVYRGWQRADGSYMPDTPATAAFSSADFASGSTANLTTGERTFYVLKSGATDLTANSSYTRYTLGPGTLAQECEYSGGSWNCSGISSFPWGRTIAQEWQNFANWYSYHRTRMKSAKAGAGYAFAELDENMRVGFDTIWNRNELPIPVGSDGGLFRDNAAKGTTNKTTWYSGLYGAISSGVTPLHSALKRSGEYFKGASTSGPWGPEAGASQITCRQNFAILTTDGFWNSGQEGSNEDNANGSTHTPDPNLSPVPTYTQYLAERPYRDNYSGTLADMAMRYWKNDLRPDMSNNVPTSGADPAFWQHMVTFGISIGQRGTLDPKVDLPALTAGTKSWPDPLDAEDAHRIDDLWHAAVNGRGEFVAASNPDEFAEGLRNALAAIQARKGSASSVAANSTSISTDTKLFQAVYVSGQWSGELKAYSVTTSGIDDTTPLWQASDELPAWNARKVFTYDASLPPLAAGATFPTVTQTVGLTTASGTGVEVANYLKGDDSRESKNSGPFRTRVSPLGDIIHSSPYYLESTDTVFVGANDGMLHAFNADTGAEHFAYVPRGVLMNDLKTLSDPRYAHRYFVDGPIVVSSKAQTPNKNILVGTLGRGGRGIYALDVTSSTGFGASDVEWDKDAIANMGNVIGKPFIAKLNNGKTGVVIGNGINSPDDKAYLIVLDISDGSVIANIPTSSDTANGLSSPKGWDEDGDGDVDYVYAGDLRGNLWKFDLSDSNTSKWESSHKTGSTPVPMFTATDGSGNRQPISGGVSIAVDPTSFKRWVFFGTGRYLTDADQTDHSVQTMYGLMDEGTRIGNRSTDLVARTTVAVGVIDGRTVRGFEAASTTMPAGKKGWYVDLAPPAPGTAQGERMIGDPAVAGQVLLFSSIIPSDDPCVPGGSGFINAINPFTGASVSEYFFDIDGDGEYTDDTVGGVPVGSVDTGVGMNTDGVLLDKIIGVGGSKGETGSVGVNNPVAPGRISWREMLRN